MNFKESLIAAGVIAVLALGCYGFYKHSVKESARATVATQAYHATQAARVAEQGAQSSVDVLGETYQQRITELENENKNLTAQLAAGTIGLRIAASCDSPAVSGNSKSTSRTVAVAPRLTEDAERNYLTLRNQIAEQRAQIEGWQSYYEAIQKLNSPTAK